VGHRQLQTLVELGFATRAPRHQKEIVDPLEARFDVTPAIRKFVLREIALHAACARLQAQFINHFIGRADRLDTAIEVGEPSRIQLALLQFSVNSPNFLSALNTAVFARRESDVCRLVASLARLWGYSGIWHESHSWIDRTNQNINVLGPERRSRLAYNSWEYWKRHGLHDQALAAAKQAVRFAEEANQPTSLAYSLMAVGSSQIPNKAIALEELFCLLRRARPLAARSGDERLRWLVTQNQAMTYFYRGELKRSAAMLALCRKRIEPMSDGLFKARTRWSLAKVLIYSGRLKESSVNLEEAIAMYRGASSSMLAEIYVWAAWLHSCQRNISLAHQMLNCARQEIVTVDLNYLQSSISLMEGRIAWLSGDGAVAFKSLHPAISGSVTCHDPLLKFDAQLCCLQAAMQLGAEDMAAKALYCALESRLRWPRENPRILEAASTWLARHEREDAAAAAWLQADAIRRKNGIVRFPAEQQMAEQTCTKLAERLGPDWCLQWQPKTPALDGDDPIGWLLGALASCSAKQSPPQAAKRHRPPKSKEIVAL
jgi:tetratricopeptide (TPR) repeat protein